jgi:uncharacterized protein
MDAGSPSAPHFPLAAPIDAYGNGGFRFAGMSHQGSLLCLPDGIWAWPVTAPDEINEQTLHNVLKRVGELDALILGTGRTIWLPPQNLREAFRRHQVAIDAMQTGPAIRVYNIMVGERRRVAAALVAVA